MYPALVKHRTYTHNFLNIYIFCDACREEDKQLIEAGFEYITEREGLKIYKKRK